MLSGPGSMSAVHAALTVLLGALTLGSLAYLVLAHRFTVRHYRRQPPPLTQTPRVSLLRPVEGADEHTIELFESFLRVDYRGGYEVVIGTIRDDDPILDVAARLVAEHPEADLRVVRAEPLGANRKTSIMHALAAAARTDYLIFADADVRVPADYLNVLVPYLVDPEVGCVTLLPRGVDAETIGGKLIALHYNQVYLPQWMMALETTGVEWAIGHTMAVRREVLEAIGGFAAFADALADDYELGHRAARCGKRVVVPPLLLETRMPAETFGQAVARLQRWKRTIRRARPRAYPGLVFTHPVIWAGLLAVLNPSALWAWLVFAVCLATRLVLAARLAGTVLGPSAGGHLWLLPLLDAVEWLTFLGAYTGSTIVWAGRRYRLRSDGSLEPLAPPPAQESVKP